MTGATPPDPGAAAPSVVVHHSSASLDTSALRNEIRAAVRAELDSRREGREGGGKEGPSFEPTPRSLEAPQRSKSVAEAVIRARRLTDHDLAELRAALRDVGPDDRAQTVQPLFAAINRAT